MSRNSELGRLGERTTADFLVTQGFDILDRNYRIRGGEIDIIAKKGDLVVFVEVKTRSADASLDHGTALEAVNYRKRGFLIKTARYWIYTHSKYSNSNFRFDVCELNFRGETVTKFNYIEAAFTLQD